MAKLHNTRFFTLDPDNWRGRATPVKVGNNRTLTFQTSPDGARVLTYRLHGNVVGRLLGWAEAKYASVELFDAGWPTLTTARAQEDFLRGLGFEASVSYARGGFRLFLRDRVGGNENLLIEQPDRSGMCRFAVYDRYSPRHDA